MAVSLKIEYLKTIPGILKIIEIVLLLLAFSCAASYNNSFSGLFLVSGSSKVSYFVAISVIAWIVAIVLFLLCLFGIYESLIFPKKTLLAGIAHGILALLLVIGAAVAASDVPNSQWCTLLEGFSTTCATLEAGVAFGFFAVIALIGDAIFHIMRGLREDDGSSPSAPPAEKNPEPIA